MSTALIYTILAFMQYKMASNNNNNVIILKFFIVVGKNFDYAEWISAT